MTKKILVAVSSHSDVPGTSRITGYWIGEVSHFCEIVRAAGYDYDVVSPQGGRAPMDPKSVHGLQSFDGGYKAYLRDDGLKAKLEATLRPDQVNVDDYAAIYFAGGHGTMWDFPNNAALAKIAADLYEQGKVVSAVCHGVAGLLGARLSNNQHLLQGHTVTGFANTEERLTGLASKVPYLTETALKERGGVYKRGMPFLSHVVVSDRLITGQNPGSTKAVARKVVEALRAKA
jgi:putative intracellular protease/amidase